MTSQAQPALSPTQTLLAGLSRMTVADLPTRLLAALGEYAAHTQARGEIRAELIRRGVPVGYDDRLYDWLVLHGAAMPEGEYLAWANEFELARKGAA